MKGKIFHLLMVYFLIFSYPLFSQDQFTDGYIVTLGGDTTRGMIEYGAWEKNPVTITFSTPRDASAQVFRAGDIRAFFVANEHYESATVEVDTSPNTLSRMDQNSEPNFVRQTVFLQSIFRGEKQLLFLKDEQSIGRFYIYDDGYKPLVYKRYFRLVDMRKMIEHNIEYKKTLFFYLKNCPSIQRKIESAKYDLNSLTRLFSSYHDCINKPVSYQTRRRTVDAETGLIGGVAISSVRFTGQRLSYYYIIDGEYNKSVGPAIGGFVNLNFIRLKGLTIANDLFYTSFRIDGKGTVFNGDKLQSSFNYHFIKLQNLVQFSLSRNGSLYISAGGSSAIIVAKDYSISIRHPGGDETQKDFESRKLEFGLVGGLGMDLGRATLDVRYEQSPGISNYSHLKTKTSRLYVLLKYPLK